MTPTPHSAALARAIAAAETSMASPVEEAYGILWRQTTDNKQLHLARKLLLSVIGVAAQRRGINAALKQFGPVNPYETPGLADLADAPAPVDLTGKETGR